MLIGLVGIGLLGGAVAQRLAAAGHDVCGYDSDPAQPADPPSRLTRAADVPSVFAAADTVVLSLPHGGIVADVLAAARPAIRADHLVLDTTTGAPEQAETAAATVAALGGRYVDTTVAGTSQQLRAGAAAMFVGAAENSLGPGQAVIDALTANAFYLGTVGHAARIKLVHNLVLGLNRAALAEGLRFAESMGIPAQNALDILQETPAASAVMRTKGPKIAARDYTPQGRVSQHLKDVGLILDQAAKQGAPTPLSSVHRDILRRAESRGYADADNAAVIEGLAPDPD